ncbi:MAG: hypothetical protein ACOC8D_02335 [bacterium]
MASHRLSNADDSRRVVADAAGEAWTVRLRAREGAQWWTAAELLGPQGWPIERQGDRAWVPASDARGKDGTLRVTGEAEAHGVRWRVADAYSFDGDALTLDRAWTYEGDEPLEGVDLLVEGRCPAGGQPQVLLPGISYNANPSAEPDRLVPRFLGERPARCLYEEHRYPVPMVCCEWDGAAGRCGLTLLSQPSRVGAKDDDRWWSLGLALEEADAVLVAASGAVATNGRRDVVYGAQCQLMDFPDCHLTVAPGARLEKEVRLTAATVPTPGHGFREALWRAHRAFEPSAKPAVSLDRFIALKLNCLRARYVEPQSAAGFLCVPPKNLYGRGPYFQWGWVGQALRGSWCSLHEGRRLGKEYLEKMGVRAADFFVGQPVAEGRLPALRYAAADGRWVHREVEGVEGVEGESSRQLGEAFANLARLVELGKRLGLRVAAWRERLCLGADFLADRSHWADGGLLPDAWTVDGTPLPSRPSAAGAPCISALALAGAVTGIDRYRVAARELMVAYHDAFLEDFATPPWGATLDARCEDKEAGLFLLAAALDNYDSIGEGRFLEWAKAAADWALTFYYVWDVAFPPDKPCRGRLRTTGWPSVSVQNHHLDAFACPSLFVRLARASGDVRYERFAQTIAWAATQGVARKRCPWGFQRPDRHGVVGEQGEAFFHTHYWQGPGDRSLWRGGHNHWNPLWVCVLPLQEAILLREAGWH